MSIHHELTALIGLISIELLIGYPFIGGAADFFDAGDTALLCVDVWVSVERDGES